MKSRRILAALLLTLCSVSLATPASAAQLTAPVVSAVAASQFDSGLFVALVTAYGPVDIVDAQLVVNNTTPIVPVSVESYEAPGAKNATLFKIVTYTGVVNPGDTLTAIITDVNGTHATRTAICGKGAPLLHITSICR